MIVEAEAAPKKTKRIRRKPHIIPKEENGIDLEKVSPFAVSVCRRLQEAGHKAFIVGGAVRDLLIGHHPKDFDVATDATPEQIKKITRRAIIIGRRFRLVHVSKGAETIEVSTFRGLNQNGVEKDINGRVIDDNVFGEQHEDAARRDFTVNAMYYDPISGDLYDYHNGVLDIRKKRLRMIGDPETRYQEDPVRILRAVRIAAKLGFSIDPKTASPMERMQIFLAGVPEARLSDEFLKMLMSGASTACVELMNKYGLSIDLPMYAVLQKNFDTAFVRKALERCDARVEQGKSISSSFIYAVLLWAEMKAVLQTLGDDLTPGQRYVAAGDIVCDGPSLRGIQRRYVSDMREIWFLQPKFERRTGRSPRKLLDHPRFRAAYDFLLLRASCGEVPHELADWWTAYEAAPEDEKGLMVQEQEQLARQRRAEKGEPEPEEEKEGGRRRRRRRKPRKKRSSDNGEEGSKTASKSSERHVRTLRRVRRPKNKDASGAPKSEGTPSET